MIAAFNIFRSAAKPCAAAPTPDPMFEVSLVGLPTWAASRGVTAFTSNPLEVAGALMRDRDPAQWDIRIRALEAGETRLGEIR